VSLLDNNRRHAFLAWTTTGFENIDQKCHFWITTEGSFSCLNNHGIRKSFSEVLLLDNNRRHAFLAWTTTGFENIYQKCHFWITTEGSLSCLNNHGIRKSFSGVLLLDNNRRHAFLAWITTEFENLSQECHFWVNTEGTLSWPEQYTEF
jgi:hypothetical protein